jgi:hypothetical protein
MVQHSSGTATMRRYGMEFMQANAGDCRRAMAPSF